MKILNTNFDDFVRLTAEKDIYCFGVGRFSRVCMNVLIQMGMAGRIKAFIDNNAEKRKQNYRIENFEYPIMSINELLTRDTNNIVILITCADVIGVYQQLNVIEQLKDNELYIWQLLLNKDFESATNDNKVEKGMEQMIPKKIHYCWFGNGEIPHKLQKCIDSWYRFCPDYEIVRWDESNYDVTKSNYMRQAYERKKWAHVSDYARLDIIYSNGGIYLDTDVELIKSLDDFLYQEAFGVFGMQRYLNTGLGFGAVQYHELIKEFRDYYESICYIEKDGNTNDNACTIHQYQVLKKYNFKLNNEFQRVKGMNVYPSAMFDSKNLYTNELNIKECTYAIHHASQTWLSEELLEIAKERECFFRNLNI